MSVSACPLCGSEETVVFHEDARRSYCHCSCCDLVHVPAQYHIPESAEKAEYLLHENHAGDEGYVRFLNRIVGPATQNLAVGSICLDFGCGPAPVLADLLRVRGYPTRVYDKFFADQTRALQQRYACIVSTEVVEHLASPDQVLDQLVALLEPGGRMCIMTQRRHAGPPDASFATWHYIRDATHIAFFSEATFRWFAVSRGLACRFPAKDIVILQGG